MSFSKTSYIPKTQNYNNFFGANPSELPKQDKRPSSTLNDGKPRGDNNTNPFSRKLKESPYYSKQIQKRYPILASKPIINSFRRNVESRGRVEGARGSRDIHPFQQTTSHFQTPSSSSKISRKPNTLIDNPRLAETATDGFFKIERPMSKQQPRPKGNTIVKEPDESLDITSNYIESDVEEIDERDKNMIHDIENDSLFMENLNLHQRPQTSKGLRKKSNTTNLELRDDDNQDLLDINERPPCRKKLDFGLTANSNQEELKIPIRSIKFVHPFSAHFRQDQGFKKKKVEDLIRFNVSSIKKSSSHHNVPFESSIGSQFLSLFANNNS